LKARNITTVKTGENLIHSIDSRVYDAKRLEDRYAVIKKQHQTWKTESEKPRTGGRDDDALAVKYATARQWLENFQEASIWRLWPRSPHIVHHSLKLF